MVEGRSNQGIIDRNASMLPAREYKRMVNEHPVVHDRTATVMAERPQYS